MPYRIEAGVEGLDIFNGTIDRDIVIHKGPRSRYGKGSSQQQLTALLLLSRRTQAQRILLHFCGSWNAIYSPFCVCFLLVDDVKLIVDHAVQIWR